MAWPRRADYDTGRASPARRQGRHRRRSQRYAGYFYVNARTHHIDRLLAGDYEGLHGARSAASGVAQVGEPYLTGWTPQQAGDFARRHGLTVLDDLDATELTRRFLTGSDGNPEGRLPEVHRIIDARIR